MSIVLGGIKTQGIAILSIACTPACADVVVGQFSGGSSTASSSSTTTGTAETVDTDSTNGTASTITAGSESGAIALDCISDDFEDGVIDEALWNLWIEHDAAASETGGLLKFTSPSSGLFDTGLAGDSDYRFSFHAGWVRAQIATPPPSELPVGLFLIVRDDVESVVLNIGSGDVRVSRSIGEETTFSESYPTDPYPGWLGLRAEGPLIYFETSNDGEAWTTVSTYELGAALVDAQALIMTQTYGDNPGQPVVTIDYYESCLP